MLAKFSYSLVGLLDESVIDIMKVNNVISVNFSLLRI